MTIEVISSGEACGATVTGVDLTKPLAKQEVEQIRAAWLKHHVLSFPDQRMSDDDLERFTLYFGPFENDPFIAPIEGRDHVIAVKRDANETSTIFAEGWHTDWSFQENPPQGTCLFGITIPPEGGDTLFANQHLALERMPLALRQKLEGKRAIHTARLPYSKEGIYGEGDRAGRSMDIQPSEEAYAEQHHPIIRAHPETGEDGIYGAVGYIVGFEDMSQTESGPLLMELLAWQTREEFQYKHKWRENMLVMWDNRSVLHAATGGYQGHSRLLHRTTIGAKLH